MKRILICLALLWLLAGCAVREAAVSVGTDAPPSTPTTTQEPVLTGVWVNRGQYTEGRDFVETMTLREDGTALIHLDYQGKDYATLEGRWTAINGMLSVTFRDGETKDRVYRYTLTDTTLTLTGDGKDVTYERSSSTDQ